MDVRIVSNSKRYTFTPLYDEMVLKEIPQEYGIGKHKASKYFVFNVGLNEDFEILPGVNKYSFIKCVNCTDSKEIYLASLISSKREIFLTLHRYDIITGRSEAVYEMECDHSLIEGKEVLSFYVLGAGYILMEHIISDNVYHELLDITSKDVYPVECDAFDSPIRSFLRLKDKSCVVLTDKLFFVNTTKLISDIIGSSKHYEISEVDAGCSFNNVYATFDYLFYEKTSTSTGIRTLVTYNLSEKEVITYKLSDEMPYVMLCDNLFFVDNTPEGAILRGVSTDKKYALKGRRIIDVINNVVIADRQIPKTFFTKKTRLIELYKNPDEDPLVSERGYYIDALCTTKDNLILFCAAESEDGIG